MTTASVLAESFPAWGDRITDEPYAASFEPQISRLSRMPNHSLERTRPARRDTLKAAWPGRSARGRYAASSIWTGRESLVAVMWSNPIAYDLSRTSRRASVPRLVERTVPEAAGTYVIFRLNEAVLADVIIDIGECGPRLKSNPKGLRGRVASSVSHSASERMAQDIRQGTIDGELRIVWRKADSKKEAKDAQDALICLFRREFSRQPRYNARREDAKDPEPFRTAYDELKALIRSSAHSFSG